MTELHFCTLFDSKYASRGLCMLESLSKHVAQPHRVTILAMDDAVPSLLRSFLQPHWSVHTVESLGDREFAALQPNRPRREFCWTAAPVLCHALTSQEPEGSIVVYLDADLLFFSSPLILFDELGSDGQILIHEHRYSRDRAHYEPSSGRFNVGFIAFRVGAESRACTARWRLQVFDKCELDPDNGFCGDQGYLNEWPGLYPGLRIMQNLGGGAAPWNLVDYDVGGTASEPTVNGYPVVFFHYHAFRTIGLPRLGFIAAQPAYGYSFQRHVNRLLFSVYAKRVRGAAKKLEAVGLPIAPDIEASLKDAVRAIAAGRYLLAI